MKKYILVLILILISSFGVFSQKVRTTAVFDADTITRPKSGFYGVGVKNGNLFLVAPTGTTKRILAANTHLGTSGQVLYSNGSSNYFKTLTLADVGVSGLTTNYISIWNGNGFSNSIISQVSNNVGIGTSSPSAKLHVYQTSGVFSLFGGQIALTPGDYTGIALGYGEHGGDFMKSAIVQEQIGDGNARGKIHILNNGSANSSAATLADARLTILHTGNVGIGTTNPTYKLDVSGTGHFTGNVIMDGNVGIGTTSPEHKIHVNGGLYATGVTEPQIATTSGYAIGAVAGTLPYSYMKITSAATNTKIWDHYTDGANLYYRILDDANTVGTTWMSVNRTTTNVNGVYFPNGNVGIGTTAPTSKLQVVGLPTYADNTAATSGGLTAGAFYRTSTGVLMVVY